MLLRIANKTRAKVLADRASEARRFGQRLIGLMGRRNFEFGEGLHLVPCNSIHTFFMRMPIDAVFLDSEKRVVKVYPALPPWRMSGIHLNARTVLELPAGMVVGSGTTEGDELSFEWITPL